MNQKIQNFVDKSKLQLAMGLSTAVAAINNPLAVFADTTVNQNVPTVGADGTVTFKGQATDAQTGVTNLMSKGSFWIGVVIGFAGLALVINGAYRSYQAGKSLQDGNTNGWQQVGNVVKGTAVAGVLMVIIGSVLAIGAATGNDLLGGGGGAPAGGTP